MPNRHGFSIIRVSPKVIKGAEEGKPLASLVSSAFKWGVRMLPGVQQKGCMQRNKIIFLTDLISIYGLPYGLLSSP